MPGSKKGGVVNEISIFSVYFSVSRPSWTLYLPLPATRGVKGLAHTNRASSSGLHQKTVEEIKPHSMNLIKDGMCQNDFCASESYITILGAYLTHE